MDEGLSYGQPAVLTQNTNHYAYPLPLLPAIDAHTKKHHSLNFYPIYGGESTETIEDLWARGENFPLAQASGVGIRPRTLRKEAPRADVKPLEVVSARRSELYCRGQACQVAEVGVLCRLQRESLSGRRLTVSTERAWSFTMFARWPRPLPSTISVRNVRSLAEQR